MLSALQSLTHTGFVNPDAVHNQRGAIDAVGQAMARVDLGLMSEITWLPTNFKRKYWDKREVWSKFEHSIKEVVEEVIASIDDGDHTNYVVFVEYMRRGKFRVRLFSAWISMNN